MCLVAVRAIAECMMVYVENPSKIRSIWHLSLRATKDRRTNPAYVRIAGKD